jgi:PAS domain S-box-containing protein
MTPLTGPNTLALPEQAREAPAPPATLPTHAREAWLRDEIERVLAFAMIGQDLQSFVDADYTYRYVNARYSLYWGRPREAIEGRPIAALFGEDVFARHVRPRLDRALGGQEVHYQATFEFPALGARHMEVSYMPARAADGRQIGVVARAHDVQALKDVEQSLQQANRLLEERFLAQQRFIHILSHDLREPINTIVNFAGLLKERHAPQLPPEGQRWLDFVHAGGGRMRGLLDDLLDLMRLEGSAPAFADVPLGEVLQDVLDDLQSARALAHARIEHGALPNVHGERSLLRVLLQNLVANALKFSRAGLPLEVRVFAEESADEWHLCVQDNGIGIPPAKRDTIFELFQRLHPRSAFEGNGMGLAICRRIAQLHGGDIRVESNVGGGSVFRVSVPRHAGGR